MRVRTGREVLSLKMHVTKAIITAALLAPASQSQAYYTNFLDGVSNGLTAAYTQLTNIPSPTPEQTRQTATIKRALKDLSKPSTSVAGDYNLFVTAALHLGALAFQPPISNIGTNVFLAFTNEAQAEINQTANRIAALNEFVLAKKKASNQLARTQATLNSISSLTDSRRAILVGKLVFAKIVAVNKLAAIGEAHHGFALNSVIGMRLYYGVAHGPNEFGISGFVAFTNSTQYEQAEITSPRSATTDAGNYTYDRTGLNTAQLVLNGSGDTNTVKLVYRSSTNGTFTARIVSGGGAQSRRGTFTLD